MSFKQRKQALLCALTLLGGLLSGCGMYPVQPELSTAVTETTADSSAAVTEQTELTESGTAVGTAELISAFSETETDLTVLTGASSSAQQQNTTRTTAGTQSTRSTRSTSRQTTASATRTTQTVTQTAPVTLPPAPADLQDILSGMTLKQKAAQMMLVGITDANTANAAAKAGVGALCMFALPFKNKTKAQVIAMNQKIQSNAAIPMIISADEEGGSINRVSINTNLRSVPFWTGRKLYDAGGWDLVISDTKEKAELLLRLGVNVNLAPVADVPLSSSNYIANRCFSLDAHETADYIRTVVTEMKKDGLGSTLKHFPGYGGSVDTHKSMGYDERDYSAFTEGDFLPFIAGIEAGADAVMVSHNIVKCMDSEYPASLSPNVHRILREELGFEGVVISDDLGMGAIQQFTGGKNPAVAAVLAGNDLVAYADYQTSVKAIVQAVKDGTVSEAQINASVLRILKWKRSLGLI